MTEIVASFDKMSAAALVAGAVFFVGDIYVLGLIFQRLFALVQDASSSGQAGGHAGSTVDSRGPAGDLPVYSPEEPAAFDERSTESAPPKTQIILLVLLKFILLVPVLIGLLYVFSAKVPALFVGMLLGLVIVCAYLFVRRRRKALAKG